MDTFDIHMNLSRISIIWDAMRRSIPRRLCSNRRALAAWRVVLLPGSASPVHSIDGAIGKRLQREHPGAIPDKSECERGMGFYHRLREALLRGEEQTPKQPSRRRGHRGRRNSRSALI